MQLSSEDKIPEIAKRTNFSIFELANTEDFSVFLKNSLHLAPEGDKTKHISIEQIKNLTQISSNKQQKDFFVVVEQPETMTQEAAAAFLKSLEEPGDNVHYVFLTNKVSQLLPTIRSRANIYYTPKKESISKAPDYPPETISLAKAYISAPQNELPTIADKIIKLHKESARDSALEILSASIELAYKTYLMTGNQSFVNKLEKLLAAEDAIRKNGHVKLQLIANML